MIGYFHVVHFSRNISKQQVLKELVCAIEMCCLSDNEEHLRQVSGIPVQRDSVIVLIDFPSIFYGILNYFFVLYIYSLITRKR